MPPSFFRKSKGKGSSSADGGGDKSSSSLLPPSSSTLLSPTPPPPPRKTNTVVEFKLVEDIRLVTIPVSACLLFLTFYIILGTMLFSMWEGWSYLDGAYFCFTSLMTIGFGDFVPGDAVLNDGSDHGQAKLIIACVYLLMGLTVVAMMINLVQEEVVIKLRELAITLGIIKDEEDIEDEYGSQ